MATKGGGFTILITPLARDSDFNIRFQPAAVGHPQDNGCMRQGDRTVARASSEFKTEPVSPAVTSKGRSRAPGGDCPSPPGQRRQFSVARQHQQTRSDRRERWQVYRFLP